MEVLVYAKAPSATPVNAAADARRAWSDAFEIFIADTLFQLMIK